MRLLPIALLLVAVGCSSNPPSFDWELIETGVDESFRGLDAASTAVVWASGTHGTVLRSVDGGRRWQKLSVVQAPESDLRDIEAFSDREAIVMTAGSPGDIFLTENAGQSWSAVHEDDRPEIFLDAMAFWNRERGVAFGDPIDGRFVVITTEDGGRSWQPVDPDRLPPAREGEAGFAASGSCLTVYGDGLVWFGTGGSVARVFHSDDFGASWSVSETPILAGADSTGIFSLTFADSANGVAVGGDYAEPLNATRNIAFTGDGGKTWTGSPEGPAGYRSAVRYLDDAGQILIATGSDGADYSVDGGRSWIALGDRGFHALATARTEDGEPRAWAIGAGGVVGRLVTIKR